MDAKKRRKWEAKVRLELQHMLKPFWPKHFRDAIKCPRCGQIILPGRHVPEDADPEDQEVGTPDIVTLLPGEMPGLVCEVKVFDGAFSFSAITEQQRRWLSSFAEAGGLAYIGLGTTRGRAGARGGRHCWLVPWRAWLHVEDAISKYQDSLPLAASKGYGTHLQQQNLDALHLLAEWELTWQDGGWRPARQDQYEWQEVQ